MSVRVADRSVSTMEYIFQAHQLVRYITDRLNKYEAKLEKDKKYKKVFQSINLALWNTPIYNAQMVYSNVQRANNVRIVDKQTLEIRSAYLQNALDNLDLLETSITSLYNEFSGAIKDKFIVELTQKIDFERKLIKGVRSSDLRRGI